MTVGSVVRMVQSRRRRGEDRFIRRHNGHGKQGRKKGSHAGLVFQRARGMVKYFHLRRGTDILKED